MRDIYIYMCLPIGYVVHLYIYICLPIGYVVHLYIYWLVVSNMTFIFHFIYGMSSFPLTNSMVFREHSPWRFLADAACHNGKNTPLLILHYDALCFIMLFYVFIEYLCIIICI